MIRPSARSRSRRLRSAGLAVALGLCVGCSSDGRDMRLPRPDQDETIITTTTTPEETDIFDTPAAAGDSEEQLDISLPWNEGERIPVQFTCAGTNVSPAVSWFDVTPDAVGIAIVMFENDPQQTVHWIVANLDPVRAYVESGELDGPDAPPGLVIGLNGQSVVQGPTLGYRGPCPPPGTSASYTIEVHALGQLIELPSGSPADRLRSAIDLVSIQRGAITAFAEG